MIVWLIDDDDITNMLHQFFLEEYFPQATVVVFSQAENALKELAEEVEYPDFLFLDINMPVMDGWEFLDAFSELSFSKLKKIQIYVLTSSLDPSDFSKAENSPIVKSIISKPLEIEKVEFLKNDFESSPIN